MSVALRFKAKHSILSKGAYFSPSQEDGPSQEDILLTSRNPPGWPGGFGVVGVRRISGGFVLYILIFGTDFGLWEVSQWLRSEIPLPMACPGAPEHFSGPKSGTGIISIQCIHCIHCIQCIQCIHCMLIIPVPDFGPEKCSGAPGHAIGSGISLRSHWDTSQSPKSVPKIKIYKTNPPEILLTPTTPNPPGQPGGFRLVRRISS